MQHTDCAVTTARLRTLICCMAAYVMGCGVWAQPAWAGEVALPAEKDNTIFSGLDTSFGAGFAIFAGRTGLGGGDGTIQRAFLKFDVAGAIPAGATITSAELTLRLIQTSSTNQTLTTHRVLMDWGEGESAVGGGGGQGAPAAEGDVTWMHTFYPDAFWPTAGGAFVPLASSSKTVGASLTQYTWPSTPETEADVQLWLDDPSQNFGWLVRGNEVTFQTSKKFGSREYGSRAFEPSLAIQYDDPAACAADLDGKGSVDPSDLATLLGEWGARGGSADLNGDGTVGAADLAILLGAWGPC